MGTKPQRLCVNCKHVTKQYGKHECVRKAFKKSLPPNPVTGHVASYVANVELCSDERRWNGVTYCGPDGKFYEEARLFKRLIVMFKA